MVEYTAIIVVTCAVGLSVKERGGCDGIVYHYATSMGGCQERSDGRRASEGVGKQAQSRRDLAQLVGDAANSRTEHRYFFLLLPLSAIVLCCETSTRQRGLRANKAARCRLA